MPLAACQTVMVEKTRTRRLSFTKHKMRGSLSSTNSDAMNHVVAGPSAAPVREWDEESSISDDAERPSLPRPETTFRRASFSFRNGGHTRTAPVSPLSQPRPSVAE